MSDGQDRDREINARLEESEERFRKLVETASDAIVSFDAEGTISFWNNSAEVTFGASAPEAKRDGLWSFLGEPGVELVREGVRQLSTEPSRDQSGEPISVVGLPRDGPSFPAEIGLSAWRAGEKINFQAIIRDISERESARDAIESLSTQHELLLQSAGEGIVGLDADGAVTFANPSALGLLGRTSKELLGRQFHPMVHQVEPQISLPSQDCPVHASLANGTSFTGETEFYRKDGTPLPVSLSSTPTIENDSVTGAVVIFQDIGDRRAKDLALRESEARYRGLFEHSPHGIYQSDPAGRFLSVNPALVEMLGYDSSHDLMHVRLVELYRIPEDRAEALRLAAGQDRVFRFETVWKRKDGSTVPVFLTGRRILDQKGRLDRYEVLVEELADRKALESQLRHAQKMEAVGQLTGGIAHDFNNVLAVVLLNAELMAAALASGDAVEEADVLAIRNAAKRASSITKKLLSFSRRAELVLEPVSLVAVVEDITSMLRSLLPENTELEVRAQIGAEARVMADPGAIEQILLNLCANSRDAMPNGGSFSIQIAEVVLDKEFCRRHPELTPGHWVHLRCSDTGVGMGPETLEKIFEPFFTTKASGHGTGLGMAMVYGLTRQQGGHVEVKSAPGEGTSTDLYFQVRSGEGVSQLVEIDNHSSQVGFGTVLLVEDDEVLRETTASALMRHGYEVILASDGQEGLEVFEKNQGTIDLVLSDLGLPRLNGLELMECLSERFERVPFILVSGYSGEFTGPGKSLPPGVRIFKKPWSLRDLLSSVQDALGKEPRQSPPPDQANHPDTLFEPEY